MPIKIAIPEPTFADAEYNARSLPPYIAALQSSGAVPVLVRLQETQDSVARLLATTQGVLLPGSGYDVDPERYGERRVPKCGPADPARTSVDELLLQDAFNLRKPVLAICHGLQTLNVWLNGSLIQDIEAILHSPVNHSPGRDVVDAHPIRIVSGSHLEKMIAHRGGRFDEAVNSSHHQAVCHIGDRLQVAAISPGDQVIEAVELKSADHFVLGVQWHPERTFAMSELSRDIFRAFIGAAEAWRLVPERITHP